MPRPAATHRAPVRPRRPSSPSHPRRAATRAERAAAATGAAAHRDRPPRPGSASRRRSRWGCPRHPGIDRTAALSPRPAEPSSPATATTSPGRAPLRSTGSRPSRTPSAVTAIVRVSETVRSPPSTAQPGASASHAARRPSAMPSTNDSRVSSGIARATSSAVGRAPIAAMSARLTAAAFQPRSYALDQARRKSGPCTRVSTVATTRPSGAASTAGVVARADERGRRPDAGRGSAAGSHPRSARPRSGRRSVQALAQAIAAASARRTAGSLEE